eukprot:TRINITY_DN8109_c0_g1_i1.p1 TRINITY_DN8109_c0_g1~~TRINITY_DN8109_c0_g1_i1.p1  ORF type:complete len:207 (-),score=21.18 TRINITY_DN8109_c0_g1_i1:48-668(-)
MCAQCTQRRRPPARVHLHTCKDTWMVYSRTAMEDGHVYTHEEKVKFMTEAMNQAELALEVSEVPVGCVFVLDGRIIARGHNETNATKNATRHAELVCIERILKDHDGDVSVLHRCDLFVTVEPCIMCASALAAIRIRGVVFGCANPRFGGCGTVLAAHDESAHLSEHPSYPAEGGVMAEEAVLVLKRFYDQENTSAPPDKRKMNTV